jgi:putative hydrolase of the HAD superfamily
MRLTGWLFTDADNTLWDTNQVFAEAQLQLLEAVEHGVGRSYIGADRLEFVRRHDQMIAAHDHRGLKYPPQFLIKKLWAELSLGSVPEGEDAVDKILAQYFSSLSKRAELRPGVKETMGSLYSAGVNISVVSEGKQERVLELLKAHGLDGYISRTVVAEKSIALYQRLRNLAGDHVNAISVGDQLDRDIWFAKSAGLRTAYFPGGFTPGWTDQSHLEYADRTISDFSEIISMFTDGHRD